MAPLPLFTDIVPRPALNKAIRPYHLSRLKAIKTTSNDFVAYAVRPRYAANPPQHLHFRDVELLCWPALAAGRRILLYSSHMNLCIILDKLTIPMTSRHWAQAAPWAMPPDSCIADPRYLNFSGLTAGSRPIWEMLGYKGYFVFY